MKTHLVMADSKLGRLSEKPVFFSDCCAGISWPLLQILASRLPQHPAEVLSVGCGSGLLESILLDATEENINILGVEVPPCLNIHLPEKRLLRVPCTASLHPDAWLASTLMFVYPRQMSLIASYLDNFLDGALEQAVWFGQRSDWPEVRPILEKSFCNIELVDGPGISAHELLVFATLPRRAPT
jgi:hypothetical protein